METCLGGANPPLLLFTIIKKIISTVALLLVLASSIYAAPSFNALSRGLADTLYCQLYGNCEVNNLIVAGNLSIYGQIVNTSVILLNTTHLSVDTVNGSSGDTVTFQDNLRYSNSIYALFGDNTQYQIGFNHVLNLFGILSSALYTNPITMQINGQSAADDQEKAGANIVMFAGTGSEDTGGTLAGEGGNITLYAGDGGLDIDGAGARGGTFTILGGEGGLGIGGPNGADGTIVLNNEASDFVDVRGNLNSTGEISAVSMDTSDINIDGGDLNLFKDSQTDGALDGNALYIHREDVGGANARSIKIYVDSANRAIFKLEQNSPMLFQTGGNAVFAPGGQSSGMLLQATTTELRLRAQERDMILDYDDVTGDWHHVYLRGDNLNIVQNYEKHGGDENNSIFYLNSSFQDNVYITGNLNVHNNISMKSSNGSIFNCGVSNTGSFSCS